MEIDVTSMSIRTDKQLFCARLLGKLFGGNRTAMLNHKLKKIHLDGDLGGNGDKGLLDK